MTSTIRLRIRLKLLHAMFYFYHIKARILYAIYDSNIFFSPTKRQKYAFMRDFYKHYAR